MNLLVVALVVGGIGFCIWRFFRKRRITKEQVAGFSTIMIDNDWLIMIR